MAYRDIRSVLLFVWYITKFQIEPEEKALETLFPREYERYSLNGESTAHAILHRRTHEGFPFKH